MVCDEKAHVGTITVFDGLAEVSSLADDIFSDSDIQRKTRIKLWIQYN